MRSILARLAMFRRASPSAAHPRTLPSGAHRTLPPNSRSLTRGSLLRGSLPRSLTLVALFVVALAATPTATRSQALDRGDEHSWIRVQNVGAQPAAIEVDYYDGNGVLVASEACPGPDCTALQPGFGWSFFQQLNGDLPDNYRGSAYVTVDQPFVGVLGRDVLRTDGTFQIAGDTLRLGTPTSRHFLPIVASNSDYVSRIAVQNVSEDRAACVQLQYFDEGSLLPIALDPPGATPGCASGGELVSPRATLLRDEHSLPLPPGFDGAATVITLPTDTGVPAADQQLSTMVDTRRRDGPGLSSYRGFADDEMSRVIVLPLADRGASEGQSTWSTRFRILSQAPTVPNEVTLLFSGRDGAGNEFELEHTVFVQSSLTCDQRLSGAPACLPAGESLPSVFFGTVRMQAIAPVAVVSQRLSPDGSLADYRGFTGQEASRQVVLPVVNKNFSPLGDGEGWNSWFRVLTFDGGRANVFVGYYSKDFPNGLLSSPLVVHGQRTFRQWENLRLPDGWVGSAVVVSDQPVVVIANLESDAFEGDPVMLYNGVSLE